MDGSDELAVESSACACKLGYSGDPLITRKNQAKLCRYKCAVLAASTAVRYEQQPRSFQIAEFSEEPNFWPSVWNAAHLRIKPWPETRSFILSSVRSRTH
jgi:hypothetical protein